MGERQRAEKVLRLNDQTKTPARWTLHESAMAAAGVSVSARGVQHNQLSSTSKVVLTLLTPDHLRVRSPRTWTPFGSSIIAHCKTRDALSTPGASAARIRRREREKVSIMHAWGEREKVSIMHAWGEREKVSIMHAWGEREKVSIMHAWGGWLGGGWAGWHQMRHTQVRYGCVCLTVSRQRHQHVLCVHLEAPAVRDVQHHLVTKPHPLWVAYTGGETASALGRTSAKPRVRGAADGVGAVQHARVKKCRIFQRVLRSWARATVT
jgi:hypothetical protein